MKPAIMSVTDHYNDVIMGTMVSQITSITIVYSAVYSDADQRKHQSSESLAFVLGIHREPVNSTHKWPVTRKMFPFDDVIMDWCVSKLCFVQIYVPPEISTKGWFDDSNFFNSWISFTGISLMVHFCDKKMRLMLYIFRYFHGSLVPIMTAVTLGENLTKKCVCIETCVCRWSWFYVPTMSQYIFNVMGADQWGIFL